MHACRNKTHVCFVKICDSFVGNSSNNSRLYMWAINSPALGYSRKNSNRGEGEGIDFSKGIELKKYNVENPRINIEKEALFCLEFARVSKSLSFTITKINSTNEKFT